MMVGFQPSHKTVQKSTVLDKILLWASLKTSPLKHWFYWKTSSGSQLGYRRLGKQFFLPSPYNLGKEKPHLLLRSS